jgi:hypothetical protein
VEQALASRVDRDVGREVPHHEEDLRSHLNLFSLSFDGYAFAGGTEEIIALSDRQLHG